jgi:hypothetical protein
VSCNDLFYRGSVRPLGTLHLPSVDRGVRLRNDRPMHTALSGRRQLAHGDQSPAISEGENGTLITNSSAIVAPPPGPHDIRLLMRCISVETDCIRISMSGISSVTS